VKSGHGKFYEIETGRWVLEVRLPSIHSQYWTN
jgi:hypothetical protein